MGIDVEASKKAQIVLSPEVVRHTLWWFGDRSYGTEPGHFITRLLNLISAADEVNRDKLSGEWPEYVQAHGLVTREPWGLDFLLSLAKAEARGGCPMSAPVHAESVPVTSGPVQLPELSTGPQVGVWAVAATVSGVVAVATLIVGLVVS